MIHTHPLKFSTLAILISAAFSSHAEEASNETESITITAQKRVQSIQDVPITVSAINSDTLEDLGIEQFDQLSDFIPGLIVQQQSINNNGYVIRGITSDDGSTNAAARVSVYLNGTDVSRSRGSYFETYDMERIEVVKGPQATLFGTAASIGAMSFITAKPEQEFSGKVKLAAGNYGLLHTEAMITGGSEMLQGRFALVKKERDGYVKNNAEHDLNGFDRFAYRASLRFTPNEDLSLDLIYNHDEAKDPGTAFASSAVVSSDDGKFSVPDTNNLGMPDLGVDRKVSDLNASLSWDMNDTFSLTYIGAYRDYDSLEAFDADGTEYEFLNFAEEAYGDQQSHEVRLNFSQEKLNGFVGASYFSEDGTQNVPFTTEEGLFLSCTGNLLSLGIDGCNVQSTTLLTQGQATSLPYQGMYITNTANNSSASIYADISYATTKNLELTAGVRVVDESRKATAVQDLPISSLVSMTVGQSVNILAGSVAGNGIVFSGEEDDSVVLPRFNALYTINDKLNAYATISKGQRSQIVDMTSGAKNVIPAEKINNYEAGLKGADNDTGLRYSASVFYQDYQNFQVTIFDGETGLAETTNAGAANNIGMEAELTWDMTDDLTIMANIALIDAGIDDQDSNGQYAGNQFRLQPETSGAISYIYKTELDGNLNFFSSGSFTYRSSVFFDIANNYQEEAVELVNLRLGVAAPDDSWDVTLSATNLLDKDYIMDAGNTGSSFGYASYIQGAPRMLSLSFTKRFGLY
ncbi:TonB-dependent receptor [uncultured Paraglaciecola sp.]|uniref:TonB-dependent receptor n=1 Tax=uncultured Paraglaciecola sp. TaxID=1765024 RepID=UPI002601FFAA|nr:TonB-dependent receptor [uncultured Paraglaciecola sp.]